MRPDQPCWWNPRVLATLLLVYLAGAVSGALVMRYGVHAGVHSTATASWKDGDAEISVVRFKSELGLTPEQARQMEGILDDFLMYYQTLQAQMDDMRSTGKDRILQILNEEQKARFQKMMNELESKRLR